MSAAKRRYDASPKGRARARRYNASPKGRARARRYAQSEKGRAANRRKHAKQLYGWNRMKTLEQSAARRAAYRLGSGTENILANK
jgi:hypothetical protein